MATMAEEPKFRAVSGGKERADFYLRAAKNTHGDAFAGEARRVMEDLLRERAENIARRQAPVVLAEVVVEALEDTLWTPTPPVGCLGWRCSMSDRQVPWALGRRALIRWRIDPAGDGGHVSGWRVAIGVLEDLNIEVGRHEPIWVLDPSNDVDPPPEGCVVEYQRLGGMERIPDRMVIATALVPGQCPRCLESTRPHAPGCMVAANMEKGVPAFFAPWVMWRYPSGNLENGLRLFLLDPENPLNGGNYVCDAKGWSGGKESRTGIVVLGPAGFTLSPWKNP